jgi:cephalosporin hydroxylase
MTARAHPCLPLCTVIRQRDAHISSVANCAASTVSKRPTVIIISGTLGRPRLLQTFDALAPLVTIGSYVVMENTAVNGHPIWRNYWARPSHTSSRSTIASPVTAASSASP